MSFLETDLLVVSHHLFYEIWMFYEVAGVLNRDPPGNTVYTNVHLESFAIHARILLDFFYNEPRQDDVVAGHYIKDWKSICPAMGKNQKNFLLELVRDIVAQ